MSKLVRAKFHCNKVTDQGGFYNDGEKDVEFVSLNVELSAVMAEKEEGIDENNSFNQATPFGELKITIDNPAVKDFFKPGVQYYLDISPAPRDLQAFPTAYDKLDN